MGTLKAFENNLHVSKVFSLIKRSIDDQINHFSSEKRGFINILKDK